MSVTRWQHSAGDMQCDGLSFTLQKGKVIYLLFHAINLSIKVRLSDAAPNRFIKTFTAGGSWSIHSFRNQVQIQVAAGQWSQLHSISVRQRPSQSSDLILAEMLSWGASEFSQEESGSQWPGSVKKSLNMKQRTNLLIYDLNDLNWLDLSWSEGELGASQPEPV